MAEKSQDQTMAQTNPADLLEVDLSQISSPALARLIEEVRNDENATPYAYDRVHNRHNRGR